MAKYPKNKKKKRSRSTSPQVNAPTQRTPSGPVQRATRVVADTITAGVQKMLNSSLKAMRQMLRDKVGPDLLGVQGATTATSSTSVVGTLIDAPSPRQNTQSPETHQLQQTLRVSTSEQLRMCSPAHDGENNDYGTSAFSTLGGSDALIIVETVQEGGSDNDPKDLEDADLGNDVRVDLSTRMSNAPNDAQSVHESKLHDLVINAKDPGQANVVMGVGALGSASGTPLDGSQDMSFGKSAVSAEFTVDGDERRNNCAEAQYPIGLRSK